MTLSLDAFPHYGSMKGNSVDKGNCRVLDKLRHPRYDAY